MEQFEAGGRTVTVFKGEGRDLPACYVPLYEDDQQALLKEVAKIPCHAHHLICISGLSWFSDMTPWKAELTLRHAKLFRPGGMDFLKLLAGTLVPKAEELLGEAPKARVLCGYSMAGLFSLWAATQTGLFTRIGSVSGSLWYPGFTAYFKEHGFKGRPERVYISVGDREKRAPDPQVALTEEAARECARTAGDLGTGVRFELNFGDHGVQEIWRTARAVRALVNSRPF
ncbi:MAG: alpha/beta hydrolase-fold protein [Aeromonadales bacterium]|nr:alpha/beta hydrolase-fold protein [Aeromonadales bacterium]MDY2891418.1 alpha/beta hydrolase-fold protein [Succinivibrio sp.]